MTSDLVHMVAVWMSTTVLLSGRIFMHAFTQCFHHAYKPSVTIISTMLVDFAQLRSRVVVIVLLRFFSLFLLATDARSYGIIMTGSFACVQVNVDV